MVTDESLDEVYQKLTPKMQKKFALEINSIKLPKVGGPLAPMICSHARYQMEMEAVQGKYKKLIP